ncbi:hypothetical protein [Sphingomonas sp.]|uniref:hypothetical protein n=1 Tax=Sphingomonas sp. TaxID=28214 RepID=UPI003B3B37F8
MLRWYGKSMATLLLVAPHAVVAAPAAPAVYTPAPGTAERTAIMKTLHAGDDSPQSRFIIRRLRVLHAGTRAIAYVQATGPIGDFQAILQRAGRSPWRKVWGEGDGGSNDCRAGAAHYAWAVRLLKTYPVGPDAIVPGIVARTAELQRMAKTDPDAQCVGDLDGGTVD